MKKFLLNILLLVVVLLICSLFGPSVLGDTYTDYINIKVLNNSTNIYYYLPVIVSLNNSQLISYGFINSTGQDTNLQEGAVDSSYLVETTHLPLYAESFLEGQERVYYYRLNNSPEQTGFPVFVGYGGNYTVVDAPSMELGQNFTINQYAFIDSRGGIDNYPVYKEGAFWVWNNATGVFQVGVQGTPPVTATISNLSGDYCDLYGLTCRMDNNNLTMAVGGNYLELKGGSSPPTWFNIANITDGDESTYSYYDIPGGTWSTYLEFWYRGNMTSISFLAYLFSPMGGSQIDIDYAMSSGTWYHVYQGPFTNNIWNEVGLDLVNSRFIRTRFYNGDPGNTWRVLFYELDVYGYTGKVTVPHGGLSVPDNANDWYFMVGNSEPYQEYAEVYTNSTLRMDHDQVYMCSSSIVTDQSGNGNFGTITWGSNPEDIEVLIEGLTSSSDFIAGGVGLQVIPEIFDDPGVIDTVDSGEAPPTLPLYALFQRAAHSMEWSTLTLYGLMMIFTIIGGTFGAYVATGSMLGGAMVGGALGIMAAMTTVIGALIMVGFIFVFLVFGLFILRKA